MDVVTLLQEFGPEVVLLVVGALAYHKINDRFNAGQVHFQALQDALESLHKDHQGLERRLDHLIEDVGDVRDRIGKVEGVERRTELLETSVEHIRAKAD